VKVTLNLMDKDVPRPATLYSLPDIPFPFRRGLHHFKNPYIVSDREQSRRQDYLASNPHPL